MRVCVINVNCIFASRVKNTSTRASALTHARKPREKEALRAAHAQPLGRGSAPNLAVPYTLTTTPEWCPRSSSSSEERSTLWLIRPGKDEQHTSTTNTSTTPRMMIKSCHLERRLRKKGLTPRHSCTIMPKMPIIAARPA